MKNRVTRKAGRRRRSAEEIERLVAEFEASGLSQAEFAHRHGVHAATLANWRRRARDMPTAKHRKQPANPVEFVQIDMASLSGQAPPARNAEDAAKGGFELVFGPPTIGGEQGESLRIQSLRIGPEFHPGELAQLLAVLVQAQCPACRGRTSQSDTQKRRQPCCS